jgi:CubicO group peptidase (beta-lactamase class C family)
MIDSWGDIDQRLELHSVRKSLLSALIGIAVSQRKINLDDSVGSLGIDDVPPGLTDTERQATVRQLLQARSGVYHPALYETQGEKRRRPARGSHAPGTFWYYNNWDFNVLGTIYERAVGMSIFDSLKRHIGDPLGMQDFRPRDGRYLRGADSMHPAYPIRMSARDLARFGLLFLRSGRWQDSTVVPPTWVKDSTTAWSETFLGSGYGYMWWTGFPDRRVAIMNLSPGGFWADGHNGQYVVVDPANDLVVVHQTNTGKVDARQMGHLMWLILTAARASDPGQDPRGQGPAPARHPPRADGSPLVSD